MNIYVPRFTVYTTAWCGYCIRAKQLLERRGLPFREVSLDHDPGFRRKVHELGGRYTVPLVLLDGRPLGGYDELSALERSGELDALLAPA